MVSVSSGGYLRGEHQLVVSRVPGQHTGHGSTHGHVLSTIMQCQHHCSHCVISSSSHAVLVPSTSTRLVLVLRLVLVVFAV